MQSTPMRGHAPHTSLLVRYVPEAHRLHVALSSSLNEPPKHAVHAVAVKLIPDTVPSPHFRREVAPTASQKCPRPHSSHA